MNLTKLLRALYHYFLAILGRWIYRNPSLGIYVIGVTGTKGKTTTIELINAGLEEAGYKTALNSSLRRKVGDKSAWNKGNSMPGRFFLQRFLRHAVQASCDFAIIEVTSEGVAQHRHAGIDFDAGVFLNIHPEHIESHGSFEKYKEAKLEFFKHIGHGHIKHKKMFFINYDTENYQDFVKAASGAGKIFLFAKSGLGSKLIGEFNKYNIGAAETVLRALNIPESKIQNAILNFKGVPGRMEEVVADPFKVYVDYAHTPDSLEAVYKTLNGQLADVEGRRNDHRLICVLGSAGGGRDKWKRPVFGQIAAKYCDEIILTNEDPYDEKPETIVEEIASGIASGQSLTTNHYSKIPDRKDAIKEAVSMARPGDIVVLTGKGTEQFMRFANGEKIPWSDKEIAQAAVNQVWFQPK